MKKRVKRAVASCLPSTMLQIEAVDAGKNLTGPGAGLKAKIAMKAAGIG